MANFDNGPKPNKMKPSASKRKHLFSKQGKNSDSKVTFTDDVQVNSSCEEDSDVDDDDDDEETVVFDEKEGGKGEIDDDSVFSDDDSFEDNKWDLKRFHKVAVERLEGTETFNAMYDALLLRDDIPGICVSWSEECDDPEVEGASWREIMSKILKDREIVDQGQLNEFFSKFLTAEDPPEDDDTFPPFHCWAVRRVFAAIAKADPLVLFNLDDDTHGDDNLYWKDTGTKTPHLQSCLEYDFWTILSSYCGHPWSNLFGDSILNRIGDRNRKLHAASTETSTTASSSSVSDSSNQKKVKIQSSLSAFFRKSPPAKAVSPDASSKRSSSDLLGTPLSSPDRKSSRSSQHEVMEVDTTAASTSVSTLTSELAMTENKFVRPPPSYRQVLEIPASSDDKIKALVQWKVDGIGNVKRGAIVELQFVFNYPGGKKFLEVVAEEIRKQVSEIFDLDPTLRLLPLKDSTTARNGWRDSSKHIRNEAELNKKLARYSQLCEYADTTTPSIRYSHKQGNAEEGEKKINTRMRFAFNLEVDDFIREVRNILSAHGGFCGPTPIQSWRIVRLGWLAYLPPGIDSKAYSKELMRMNGFRYVLALVYTWVNQTDLPNREEFKGFKAWSIYSAATHAEVAAALLQRNLRIDTPKHEFPFCSVVRYVPDAAGVKLSLIGIDAWQCIKDLMSDMRYKHRSVMTESTVSMLVPAIRSAFLPVDTKTELFGTLTFAKMCFSVWAIPHKDEDFEKVKATVESMQPAEDEPPRGMETVAENEMEDGEDEVSKVSETHSRRLGEPQSAKKPTAVDNVTDDTEAEGIWTTVPSSKRKKKGTKRVDIQADDPSPAHYQAIH